MTARHRAVPQLAALARALAGPLPEAAAPLCQIMAAVLAQQPASQAASLVSAAELASMAASSRPVDGGDCDATSDSGSDSGLSVPYPDSDDEQEPVGPSGDPEAAAAGVRIATGFGGGPLHPRSQPEAPPGTPRHAGGSNLPQHSKGCRSTTMRVTAQRYVSHQGVRHKPGNALLRCAPAVSLSSPVTVSPLQSVRPSNTPLWLPSRRHKRRHRRQSSRRGSCGCMQAASQHRRRIKGRQRRRQQH